MRPKMRLCNSDIRHESGIVVVLPKHKRACDDFNVFKSTIKTVLFEEAFMYRTSQGLVLG
jgi:hypothetical protein